MEATGRLEKFRKMVFSSSVYNVIGGPMLMNRHFSMLFGADEVCVIQHLPTGSKFYPQKFGEHHFLQETVLKQMALMRPVKVREVSFKSREWISGCYRVPEEFEMDIRTPIYSD